MLILIAYTTPFCSLSSFAQGASRGNWFSRHKLLTGLIALVVILAIALGAGLGAGLNNSNNNQSATSSNADAASSGGKSGNSGSSSGASKTSSGSSASPTSSAIKDLAKWNLTDTDTKMWGASLGNWLVLERWMDEDWIRSIAGDDAWDEWSFIEILGKDKALTELQNHWNTWVTESDLDTMQSAGFNTIRIPVGYWAFIPAADGEPYLAQSGQIEQMNKMLEWLYNRGMYASIDLHAMPGSQNGDQSSGHNTSSSSTKIGWFSDTNQQLSMQTLNATIAWIQNSTYKSVVNSIGIVNEPRPLDSSFSTSQQNQNLQTLKTYYTNAYNACKAAGIPALFHHGFYNRGDQTPAQYWSDFATGKDPNYLGYEDHPYPGWFTPNNNSQSYMENNVCEIVQGGVGFPVPMLITEWSSINGVGDESWTSTYTNLQAAGYAWSGGSIFWSFKTVRSDDPVVSLEGSLQDMYSAVTLIDSGVIPKKQDGQTIKAFLSSQSGADICGSFPTETWTNPSTAGTGYSSRRRAVSAQMSQRSSEDVTSDQLLSRRQKRRID